MDKVNPFPALIVPFSLILLLNLFIEFKVLFKAIFLTNAGKLFLDSKVCFLIYLIKNQEIHLN